MKHHNNDCYMDVLRMNTWQVCAGTHMLLCRMCLTYSDVLSGVIVALSTVIAIRPSSQSVWPRSNTILTHSNTILY